MKQLVTVLLVFVALTSIGQRLNSEKKVLMVVSSYGKGQGQTRPGYEIDEFSQAYLIFKDNGLTVDVASPRGGKVEPDQYNKEKVYNQRLLADEYAYSLLEETIPTSRINSENYDAIYIVGGKGAMFDLPYDPSLQDIILEMYERPNTIIASVCHGPAVFANVKSGDKFIVKDIEMTGFTNEEEALFGKKWVSEFPFSLEDQLVLRGAKFTKANFMLPNVSVSGSFVTGQNPFSTARSAEEVVRALGLTPKEHIQYPDEHTVYAIKSFLNEELSLKAFNKLLKQDTSAFDIPLLAIYGYYHIMANEGAKEKLRQGTQLVELSAPYFFNENLQIMVAQTYIAIEEKSKAKKVLNDLIARDKLTEQASQLLEEVD
tara:strand:- start:705 stop:1823 length:1119 start_codon:yes stop_codon:yes gene_type:complete